MSIPLSLFLPTSAISFSYTNVSRQCRVLRAQILKVENMALRIFVEILISKGIRFQNYIHNRTSIDLYVMICIN